MVGSAIIRRLVSAGYENILSNYYKKKPVTDYESRITFVELDLRRQSDTERFFERERPDSVFLAAAKVGGILANNTYRAEFIYDNLMISANIIHASYRSGVKKLLNLGSSCIYPKCAPQPMKEEYLLTDILEPTNEPYAIAKISAIKLCRYYNEQYGTNFISVMPTNLYGPNDNFNLETSHVLPALIRKFHLAKLLRAKRYDDIRKDLQKYSPGFNLSLNLNLDLHSDLEQILKTIGVNAESVTLWGSGEPFREFLFVDDLAAACVFLMEKYNWEEIGEFVNIGVGKDIRIKDLARLIKECVGFEGEILHDITKPDGMYKKLLSTERMQKLGWQAETTLEDGIKKTYEWYVIN